tara:strand:- start:9034 stop:9270 length:237 start_codon:yes stop_codon:yes gene_type:complete
MTDDEYEIRKSKLEQEIRHVKSKIDNFDTSEYCPVQRYRAHHKTLDILKDECEDIINELEVNDFLDNGAGYNKNNENL